MIHEFVMAAALGMVVGFVITIAAIAVGRSPVLERRRWKAIWANERWLKDLQDFIGEHDRTIQSLRTWLARLSDLHGTIPHVDPFENHYLDVEDVERPSAATRGP